LPRGRTTTSSPICVSTPVFCDTISRSRQFSGPDCCGDNGYLPYSQMSRMANHIRQTPGADHPTRSPIPDSQAISGTTSSPPIITKIAPNHRHHILPPGRNPGTARRRQIPIPRNAKKRYQAERHPSSPTSPESRTPIPSIRSTTAPGVHRYPATNHQGTGQTQHLSIPPITKERDHQRRKGTGPAKEKHRCGRRGMRRASGAEEHSPEKRENGRGPDENQKRSTLKISRIVPSKNNTPMPPFSKGNRSISRSDPPRHKSTPHLS
jgi:hypothetical protein